MERDAKSGTNSEKDEAASFTNELKRGIFVLLHVRVGKLEPASIQLVEGTDNVLIKTNSRDGWCAWCYCYTRCYEIAPGQLESIGSRTHTRKLNRSISVVNGGDPHLAERVLQRSLSLIRRYPSPESIDLTLPTAEMEERLRNWVDKNLTISAPMTGSSRSILKALQGRDPSDGSDNETTGSEDQQTPKSVTQVRRVVAQKGPAAVHPAQRRGSVKLLKSSGSAEWDSGGGSGGRRGSTRSEPGRGWDVPVGVVYETEVADQAAGEGGKGGEDLWTWKEPPVLRRLGSGRGGGGGGSFGGSSSGGGGSSSLSRGSASSRGKGISALSEAEPVPTDPSEEPPRRHEPVRPSSLTAKLGSERAPAEGHRERRSNSGSQPDFWNPLGLMPEDAQPRAGSGLRRGTPLSTVPPPGGRGEGAEEGSSQHSATSSTSSARRGSARGLRRGVPFNTGPAAARGRGQSAEEGSSGRSMTRDPADAE